MDIGVDNGYPIGCVDWETFDNNWWQQRPVFVGRYFGPAASTHLWQPGEGYGSLCNNTTSFSNSAAVLPQRVVPIQGPTGGTDKYMLTQSTPPYDCKEYAVLHAVETCSSLSDALLSGELTLPPESGMINIFLDVEFYIGHNPPSWMSSDYWMKWAATVESYTATLPDGSLCQPFRPCIYCFSVFNTGATLAEPYTIQPHQTVDTAISGQHVVYGFWFANPTSTSADQPLSFNKVPTPSALNFVNTKDLSLSELGTCTDLFKASQTDASNDGTTSVEIPVIIWQYAQLSATDVELAVTMDLDATLTDDARNYMALMPDYAASLK